jgi:hypothetical protein
MLRATRGDVIGRARWQSRRRSFPSAALRKIDIFFDERPTHSKEYRSIVSFSVSDFAQPMSNSPLAIYRSWTFGVGRWAFSGLAHREHELLEFARANLALGDLAQS